VMSAMENQEAARVMFGVASLLESQGANPYRVRAYRRAALNLMRMRRPATALTGDDGQVHVPWLGDRLRRKVGELVTRGEMQFHKELVATLPKPLRSLLAVPGIGPKTAQRFIDELGIGSAKGVANAADRGRIRRLRGFGPASEARLGGAAQALIEQRRRGPGAQEAKLAMDVMLGSGAALARDAALAPGAGWSRDAAVARDPARAHDAAMANDADLAREAAVSEGVAQLPLPLALPPVEPLAAAGPVAA
jgi:DNA polymerase (family X)